MKEIWESWKTTAAAMMLAALVAAFLARIITLDQFVATAMIVIGGGLAVAKDAGK